jgi:transcriptional regulator with XRE-family HTH domain
MTLQDTVLEMAAASLEVAHIGREALIVELMSGADPLTLEEATGAVNGVLQLTWEKNARKMRAQQLHEQGLSQRAIAAELGVSKDTVGRDLEMRGSNDPPENVEVDHVIQEGAATEDDEPAVAPPEEDIDGEVVDDLTAMQDAQEKEETLEKITREFIHSPVPEFAARIAADAVRRTTKGSLRGVVRNLRDHAKYASALADILEKGTT